MILKGVDISTWDTDIDWDNLSSSTDFVIIRSSFGTQGTGDVDNRFFEHINNAKSHGVNTGVYHYIYAKDEDEARREARFCLDTIKGYKLEYPVALDIEDASLEDLDSDTLTNICKAFCSEIEKAGYYVMIYANLNFVTNLLNMDDLSNYDLWLAHYESENPGYDCNMWQYTDSGSMKGIDGNCDLNLCYENYPDIIKNAHLNGY